MQGKMFAEFLDMVEDQFGIEITDDIIESARLRSGGAYVSTESYDHQELSDLAHELSRSTGIPEGRLMRAFGTRIFQRFRVIHPQLFAGPRNAFEFLRWVEKKIHPEIRTVYPQAELPRFECRMTGEGVMELLYTSPRPFGDLAEGLLMGCIEHCGGEVNLYRDDLPDTGQEHHVRFTLRQRSPGSTRAA